MTDLIDRTVPEASQLSKQLVTVQIVKLPSGGRSREKRELLGCCSRLQMLRLAEPRGSVWLLLAGAVKCAVLADLLVGGGGWAGATLSHVGWLVHSRTDPSPRAASLLFPVSSFPSSVAGCPRRGLFRSSGWKRRPFRLGFRPRPVGPEEADAGLLSLGALARAGSPPTPNGPDGAGTFPDSACGPRRRLLLLARCSWGPRGLCPPCRLDLLGCGFRGTSTAHGLCRRGLLWERVTLQTSHWGPEKNSRLITDVLCMGSLKERNRLPTCTSTPTH